MTKILTIIIIIYLILMCSYSYVKFKNNSSLIVYNNGQLFFQIVIIFFFFGFYVLFLRFLNLFRLTKILDLHSINISFNLVLFLILLYNFRKLILYIFKVSWFKFHYVMMCETNFSEKINDNYKFIFYNFIYSPAYYSYKYINYINYLMSIILIYFIFNDILFNDLILNYSLWFLKYYSFFKLIYLSYSFMIKKQNLILDYYYFNKIYPGNSKESFFINFSDDQHKKLISESEAYSSGIILEKFEYLTKYLGNTKEMPYFKSLR